MRPISSYLDRPSHLLDEASHLLGRRARRADHHVLSIGGIGLFVVAALLFVWLFPEIRRYVRIERM